MSRNGEVKPGNDSTWKFDPIKALVNSSAKVY
jgi:hypothetical protein